MSLPLGTPFEAGYQMPGEFEPHAACWLLWPERPTTWRAGARPAQAAFAQVVRAIAQFEPVRVGATPDRVDEARAALPGHVQVMSVPSDDSWIRDTGPTVLRGPSGERLAVRWRFNAYSGLYAPCERDQEVARRVADAEGLESIAAPFVLEGGAIHSDGAGTLLTTEECLLHPGRNPGLNRLEIEGLLCAYTGARRVVWLGQGVFGDSDTNGHIDNLACFAEPGVVALAWEEDPADPQHERSVDAFTRLSLASDAAGRSLEIVKIPMPRPVHVRAADLADPTPIHRESGQRLAASYANFYIANGGVVVPTFDDPADRAALDGLARLFPDRRVVGVPSREILLGGGNVHCITQQIPIGGVF